MALMFASGTDPIGANPNDDNMRKWHTYISAIRTASEYDGLDGKVSNGYSRI